MTQTVDWIAIEGHYLGGSRSIRAIADEHGVSETAIRKRATKFGWTRDIAGAKREAVKAALAGGSRPGSQFALRTKDEEAAQDVQDMEQGVRIYRNVLAKMEAQSVMIAGPIDAKVIVEATTKAIDGIRKIRGLDDPDRGTSESVFDELQITRMAEVIHMKAARRD